MWKGPTDSEVEPSRHGDQRVRSCHVSLTETCWGDVGHVQPRRRVKEMPTRPTATEKLIRRIAAGMLAVEGVRMVTAKLMVVALGKMAAVAVR